MSTSQCVQGQTPAPPHNFHRNTWGEMEHGAGAASDAFAAVRGLMVVRSAAGTVHTVGCPSLLHAGHLNEIHLCRICPNPEHLLFVSKGDSSRLAHRDLGCRYLGNFGVRFCEGVPQMLDGLERGKKEQRDRKSQCQTMSNIEWTRAASVFISI